MNSKILNGSDVCVGFEWYLGGNRVPNGRIEAAKVSTLQSASLQRMLGNVPISGKGRTFIGHGKVASRSEFQVTLYAEDYARVLTLNGTDADFYNNAENATCTILLIAEAPDKDAVVDGIKDIQLTLPHATLMTDGLDTNINNPVVPSTLTFSVTERIKFKVNGLSG